MTVGEVLRRGSRAVLDFAETVMHSPRVRITLIHAGSVSEQSKQWRSEVAVGDGRLYGGGKVGPCHRERCTCCESAAPSWRFECLSRRAGRRESMVERCETCASHATSLAPNCCRCNRRKRTRSSCTFVSDEGLSSMRSPCKIGRDAGSDVLGLWISTVRSSALRASTFASGIAHVCYQTPAET